jgi:cytochrome c-type biogenesis protein
VSGGDLTILLAFAAGVISFLSPCVLPLVPAYLGHLTAVAVRSSAGGGTPSRWLAFTHAGAYVLGFGTVFTLLGVTATYAASGLIDILPLLRQIGGIVLIVMGLSLMGILRIPLLERAWRPLDAGAMRALATETGGVGLATTGGPGPGDRLGERLVAGRGGVATSFGLGAIFAVGWTPCVGIVLGAILTLAATAESRLAGGVLLFAFTLGLGVPFLLMGVLYDRVPAIVRTLTRYSRTVSLIGGGLVVAVGVAMLLDWLAFLPRYFRFWTFV